jgi:hypothetical protein
MLGEDLDGDEAAGARGIPFRQSEDEDNEFAFRFQGPARPICPGEPTTRPEPGDCTATPDQVINMVGDPGSNPLGSQIQYVIIAGSDPTPLGGGGGVCGPAIVGTPNTSHNWASFDFTACTSGTMTFTLEQGQSAPFTGASCGQTGLFQVALYDGGTAAIVPTDGCVNIIQDFMTGPLNGGMAVGQSFEFPIPRPGDYAFIAHSFCDVAGAGTNTFTATFDLDFP